MIFISVDTNRIIERCQNMTEEAQAAELESMAEYPARKDAINNLYETFGEYTHVKPLVIEVFGVQDESGRKYDHLKFVVSSVFAIDKTKYFSDGNFAVPVIEILETNESVIENILL